MANIHPRTDAEWDRVRPTFTTLYITEQRPLPEVMQILRDKYNFVAR